MKRTMTIFEMLAGVLMCGAEPQISFAEPDHSLGTFRLDLIQEAEYVFYNTGDEPLEIFGVNTGCSCVQAEFPTEAVAPGDSAVIKVRYNGRHQPTGRFSKPIKVRSNAADAPLTRLVLRGKSILG